MKKVIFTILIVIHAHLSTFSQVFEPPSNLNLYADKFDVYLSWEMPNTPIPILKYNIYRNGTFLANTEELTFFDYINNHCYVSYYITAIYETGESSPSETKSIYISLCWFDELFDDMEDYTAGEQIACVNDSDWTTWSNLPCTEEDAFITDELAYSGINSICIEGNTDLVNPINNYTSGIFIISFNMYIPIGNDAYFNTLQEFYPNPSWGMEVFFDTGGLGSLNAGATQINFTFPYNTWFHNEIYIYLDSDWAEYYINDQKIYEWVWSIGAHGSVPLCQLGGSNFWPYIGSSGQSKCYIDDYWCATPTLCIPGPPTNSEAVVINNNVFLNWTAPGGNCELLGFNVYRDMVNIAFTTEIFFNDLNIPPGEYEYYITAVYDEGESFPSNTVSIHVTTSIKETNKNIITTYPNPAKDFIHIESDLIINNLRLYDLKGRIRKELTEINKTNFDFSIYDCNNGIYFLMLQTDNEIIFSKNNNSIEQ
ncbi:MAG: T9SS type A sorting domain-containing protein [Bacteroidales bacterium]|nr:T9SS type A sorting domain-containing protein [Bacteroidales bacterium]